MYVYAITIILFIKIFLLNIDNNNKLTSNVVFKVNILILLIILMCFDAYTNNTISIFYSHAIFSNNVKNFIYFIIFFLLLSNIILLNFLNVNFLNSIELTSIMSFFTVWIILLFCITNFFSFVFVIELISSSVFIYLIIFYNFNNSYNYFFKNFNSNKEILFLNSFIYIFWISFISIINFFLFIYLILNSTNVIDFFLIDYILIMQKNSYSSLNYLFSFYIFLILIFSFFLKLGFIPFFLWKPYFFKILPYKFIYLYVTIFFFLLFIFFVNLIIIHLNFYITDYYIIFILLLFISFILLFLITSNNSNIKIFLAISSVINSLNLFYGILYIVI